MDEQFQNNDINAAQPQGVQYVQQPQGAPQPRAGGVYPQQPVQGSFGQGVQQPVQGGFGQGVQQPVQSGFGQGVQQPAQGIYTQGVQQPVQGGFGQGMQQQPVQGGFGQGIQQPVQGGFGQGIQQPIQGGFGQAAQTGFGPSVQGGYQTAAPQQYTQAVKKSRTGLVVALVLLAILLLAGGAVLIFRFAGRKEISLSKFKLNIEVGEEQGVRVTNYDDDLSNVHLEYESENPDIVRISNEFDDGFYVEGVSKGSATITVKGRGCKSVELDVRVSE